MPDTLLGKVAIVTGGSRGIGEGIARRLASAGATVVLTYNSSPERAEAVTESITAAGGAATAVKLDSGDRDEIQTGIAKIAATHGRLDILVNNAGVGGVGPIEDITAEEYRRIVDVNFDGVFHATQEAVRHMTSGGRVITIGSINAERIHFGGLTVYAMTKAGVAGFTRALARELGPRGITVNTIQPGSVDTEMNPKTGAFADFTKPHIAVDRYGTADEVGSLVVYLAGPDAAYITGAALNVDGGFAA
jgi:3-oxoacyl-[acyl-carrier protein] reductase